MGTSGNRPGFKVFSINTTIRNPKRYPEFLEVLQHYHDKELTKEIQKEIYVELIRRGTYKLTRLDSVTREKYEDNILLTDEEIYQAILNNPQKTGDEGRLMTQIRAIKDTGFITLEGKRNSKKMKITPLGEMLIAGENIEDIYSKAMIGLHANNPQRNTIYNRSVPFLNTLFIIDALNKHYSTDKGITRHEFAFFVLPMKDCDYITAVKQIIKYREKFGDKENQKYLEDYIYNTLAVNRIAYNSINGDYTDDVYRKFSMTGLITRNAFGYIRFNSYNIEKVKSILEQYKDYAFKDFESTEDYIAYLTNIKLPWEQSEEVKRIIINNQKEFLNAEVDERDSLDKQMEKLNKVYYQRVFADFVDKVQTELIIKELVLLSRNKDEESKFDEVPRPVRLEWFIAMLTAKVFGAQYVNPNLLLDDDGIPKSFAPGGRADIEFNAEEIYCLIEVTLMRDSKQQLNSETTSIAAHLEELEVDKEKCSILIAPYIHSRVVKFFKYENKEEGATIVASTIEHYIESIKNKSTSADFLKFILDLKNMLLKQSDKEYCDEINFVRVEV